MATPKKEQFSLPSFDLTKPGLVSLLFKRSFLVGMADYIFHIGLFGSIITGAITEISNFIPAFAGIFGGLGWLISWAHGVTGVFLVVGGVGFVTRYFKNRYFKIVYGRLFYLDLLFMLIIAITGTLQALAVFGLIQVYSFVAYPLQWAASIHVTTIYVWIVVSLFLDGAVRHALATVVWRFTSPEKKDAIFATFSDACGRCGRCVAVCPLYEAPPCSANCPGNIDVPSYLARIRNGQLQEAARILVDRNPFPSITGLVCPRFCASMCNRCKSDESVFVRGIERFMGEYILDNSVDVYKPPASDTEKTVAIVGSGPAGLSAAYYLRKVGHQVTVFDKNAEPGGMLTYGIPAYRLSRSTIRRQAEALQGMGIKFKLGVDVGSGVAFESLQKEFDSVFLASGAWGLRALGIEREELVTSGLDLLTNATLGRQKASGNRVLVIGGGNVAIDAARTALRLGAKESTIVYRRSEDEMPAPAEEIHHAREEGVKFVFLATPLAVRGDEKGKVEELECTKNELGELDESGRRRPVPIEGSNFRILGDVVINAIGQSPGPLTQESTPGVETGKDGAVIIEKETGKTTKKGVFAGGDVTTGTASVIEAIAAGRRAAASINSHLGGELSIDEVYQKKIEPKLNTDHLRKTEQIKVTEVPQSERGLDADARYLDFNAVEKEAERCLECGFFADKEHAEPPLLTLRRYSKTIADKSAPASEVKYISERLEACRLCGLCVAVCPFSFNFVDVRKRLISLANERYPEPLLVQTRR